MAAAPARHARGARRNRHRRSSISTVAFALAHRNGRRVHLVTGGVFGCLYVVSASLVCAASAHAVYNIALSGLAAPRREREIGAPV